MTDEAKPQKVRLRAFAGMVNRAKECLVPVHFADHDDGFIWLPVPKSTAKTICDAAEEAGIEEIEGIVEEDGCLYIEGPSDEEEAPPES